MNIEEGKEYTIVTISPYLANTNRFNLFCVESGDLHTAIFKEKGKHKTFRLSSSIRLDDALVFEGINAVMVDSDTKRGFRGNACFNLVGEPQEIRRLIEAKNLNPGAKFAQVLAIGINCAEFSQETETLVFPELEIQHAVIARMKEVKKPVVV